MRLFARAEQALGRRSQGEAQLLLEGSWPPETGGAGLRFSLDDALDARHAWIDREAARLADVLAGPLDKPDALPAAWHSADATSRWAYINALPSRYQLVQYIRLVAFFEQVRRPAPRESMELYGQRGRDEAYAALLRELGRRHGFARAEYLTDSSSCNAIEPPPNARWRRQLGAWTRYLEPAAGSADDPRPRVVLCGNPRILDPVCAELLRAGCRVWWLYDRWAARGWLRWTRAGVSQLVCDASLGRENALLDMSVSPRLACRGVDLGRPVDIWRRLHAMEHGARQTRLIERVEEHFAGVQPHLVLVDEDATPLPRIVVATARSQGGHTAVVQHGAPCIRFGFAPLVADRTFVWGETSADQLVAWGVPRARISVTGSPAHDRLIGGPVLPARRTGTPRILLLATVPPRDDRADALAYHLTTRTHEHMLQCAIGAVRALPEAELVVRLHPRTRHRMAFRQLAATNPGVRIARPGPLWHELRRAHCVISCASSAGVEALLAGVPVIQLLPRGSAELLPNASWGFLGTAREQDELEALLRRALTEQAGVERDTLGGIFANLEHSAAPQIVEQMLAEFSTRQLGAAMNGSIEPLALGSESCRAPLDPPARRWVG